MTPLLKTFPMVLALVAAPCLAAAAADQHAAHPPAAGGVAKPTHKMAKGHTAHGCPMMKGEHGAMMHGAAGQGGTTSGDHHAAMMKDGHMHCMHGMGPGGKPPAGDAPHDHDHDQSAPK